MHLAQGDTLEVAAYEATIDLSEIYCRLDRNEDQFLVVPENVWSIDVPAEEFRLDRARH